MRYEELDRETRRWMLEELMAEEKGDHPYRSPSLSAEGKKRFGPLIEEAIINGTEESLAEALKPKELWAEYEPSPLGGVRRTEPARAARALARTEFNTWYVRGLCRRLMEEGEVYCQVYRAAEADAPGDLCEPFQGMVLEIRHLYNGHRIKYWPKPNDRAFSVPCGPQCRHSVRRISSGMKAMIELEEGQLGASFRRTGP